MSVACRALTISDYADACVLYQALSSGQSLPDSQTGITQFEQLLAHHGTALFGAQVDMQIVSMATLHILPNMTYLAKPYALIENVATLPQLQGKGYGRAVMEFVAKQAWASGAYKIMLLTGRSNAAKGFYERLGYNADEKFGMIQRRPKP